MYVPTSHSPLSDTQVYYLTPTAPPPPPQYDRTPPRNITDFPKCASRPAHDTAQRTCKPIVEVIRGLGLLDLAQANPCWVATLPICPPPHLKAAIPRPTPAPAQPPAPPQAAPTAPAPTPAAPAPAQPVRAGFTTGGLLAVAAAVGVGAWLVFGRKKKQPAPAAA